MSKPDVLEYTSRHRSEGELTLEQLALFEARAERLRRHPEQGITWARVRAELKRRPRKSRAGAGK